MALILRPEVKSGLGEDTFWCWAERELGGKFRDPVSGDTVLQYSTMGMPQGSPPDTFNIGLLWELYPEMKRALGSDEWDSKIKTINECAAWANLNLVPSELVGSLYPDVKTQVMPIGIDMDLFQPLPRDQMRTQWNVPADKKVGLWCGTSHPMKGFDRIPWDAADYWIIIWKARRERAPVPKSVPHQTHTTLPQRKVAELMSCADFYCMTGLLRPYFLIEYEAMACGLRLFFPYANSAEKDFPQTDDPRGQLRKLGWGRDQVKEQWKKLLS